MTDSLRARGPVRPGTVRICALPLALPDPEDRAHLDALRQFLLGRLVQAMERAPGRPHWMVLPALAALLPALVLAGPRAAQLTLAQLARRFGGEAAELWLEWCRQYARALDAAVCTGSGLVPDGGGWLHVAWIVGRDGRVRAQQAQVHVRPEERREWGLRGGEELAVAEVDGVKVGLLVGSDVLYPEAGHILALQGADVLLCLPLPSPPCTPRPHGGAFARACVHRVYALEASLTGSWAGQLLEGCTVLWAPQEPEGPAAPLRASGEEPLYAELDRAALERLRRARLQDFLVRQERYLSRLLPLYAEDKRAGARQEVRP